MENDNESLVEQPSKRVRRTGEELRAAKIAALEEKIRKKEEQLAELEDELEELKRPPQLSEREKQLFLRRKIEDGSLTESEAFQLGYQG